MSAERITVDDVRPGDVVRIRGQFDHAATTWRVEGPAERYCGGSERAYFVARRVSATNHNRVLVRYRPLLSVWSSDSIERVGTVNLNRIEAERIAADLSESWRAASSFGSEQDRRGAWDRLVAHVEATGLTGTRSDPRGSKAAS